MATTLLEFIEVDSTGLDLIGLDYTTMSTDPDSGIYFPYDNKLLVLLNNDTVAPAIYKILMPDVFVLTELELTTPDKTITVAAGELFVLPLYYAYRDSDGNVTIECNAEAKIALVKLP